MAAEEGCRSCHQCGSVWFDLLEARRFFALDDDPKPLPPLLALSPTGLVCPECQRGLGRLEIEQDLVIDQCEGCGGLLFEEGESLKMRGRLQVRGVRERVERVVFRQGPYR